MLFKVNHLKGIKSGKVTLAFRKWKKPAVLQGSLIKTPIGQIEIKNIAEIAVSRISQKDAQHAGYLSREELIKDLDKREGTLFRIEVAYGGADPRIALRENTDLSEEELNEILTKLTKFDKLSKKGPWTLNVLQAIKNHPKTLAKELGKTLGYEKEWFKPNVRKLKNMGLTISHEVGYTLSPRGELILKRLLE